MDYVDVSQGRELAIRSGHLFASQSARYNHVIAMAESGHVVSGNIAETLLRNRIDGRRHDQEEDRQGLWVY